MSTIGLEPITLSRAVLTIAEDEYTASINEAAFLPQVEWEWLDGWGGAAHPVVSRVRWTLAMGYAQDFTTADALAIYLVEHAAQRKRITLTPTTGGRTLTADAMIVPGQLGGPSGEILTATVVLPLYTPPTITGA